MAITIKGANGETISLGDATGRAQVPASQLQSTISNAISDDPSSVGVYTNSGEYQASNAYKYIVVADDSDTSSGSITINNSGFAANYIDVLAGRKSGTTYNADGESGQLINTVGNLTFNGSGKIGAWTVYTGNGNSIVNATDGNNRINTGVGKNQITLGTGNNSVFSQGQDTITGGGTGYQSVTLTGTQSDVTLGANTFITDTGNQNTMSVGENSTITGGSSGKVTFNGGDQNVFQAGNDDTVNATGGAVLKVVHGNSNTYNLDHDLTLLNGSGNTSITINGQISGFGASDSNYTLNATGNTPGLFVADAGNETLNASGSTAALQIFANTVSGAQTNFVATGGAGNDTLVAGTGNSTFTGGAGDNVFMFTKEVAQNGNTVITDFAKSSQNKIDLFNFGLDSNSLTQLLQHSQNDSSGSAVLNLDGHSITIQGVSVSDLNIGQFEVANAAPKTA